MSATLRKRNHQWEHVPHFDLTGAFLSVSLLILIVAIVTVILGHFNPAG